jgi:hypothetical protein
MGRVPEARRHIDAALAHRAAHGEQYYAPELFRLHGLILSAQGAPLAQVHEAIDHAMALARQHGAVLFAQRV